MTEDVERTGPDEPRRQDGDTGQVILGFDAGWDNPRPLRAAADEAQARRAGLAVVTVLRPGQYADPPLMAAGGGALEHWTTWSGLEARRLQRAAARSVRIDHPDQRIATLCLDEDEVRSGAEPFSEAVLLVMGVTNRFGGRPFGLNSTSRLLMGAVRCPTLVVPAARPGAAPDDRQLPVLAAVPAGRRGVEVICAAERERQLRGCDLHLLHAFDTRPLESPTHAMHRAADEMTALTSQAGLAPSAGWCVILTRQTPPVAIRERAAQAGLVVLGSRPGSPSGLVLRGLTRELLDGLSCPVLLLPAISPMPQPVATAPVPRP